VKLEERFWSKVNFLGEDYCWEWRASCFDAGYGGFKYCGKYVGSHRMSWFLTYGEFPVLFVLHTCDNRKCCNPAHLFLGTHQDNMDDMKIKGRSGLRHGHPMPKGESSSSSKLDRESVLKIRSMLAEGTTGREIAELMGVGETIVSYVKNNRRWNNI
jgi:hypothetical protein